MKLISFSLFGSEPRYCEGMIRNAILAKVVYPHWKVRVYTDLTVPTSVLVSLDNLGCEIAGMNHETFAMPTRKMAWRFLAAREGHTVIFRDADSLLSPKEATAVNEWKDSNKANFHHIRDHDHHYSHPMFGGLWGCKIKLPEIKEWIEAWPSWGVRLDDMLLLTKHVWPIAKGDIMQHCGAGSERMQWGEWIRLQAGEDYHLGAGVTAKW